MLIEKKPFYCTFWQKAARVRFLSRWRKISEVTRSEVREYKQIKLVLASFIISRSSSGLTERTTHGWGAFFGRFWAKNGFDTILRLHCVRVIVRMLSRSFCRLDMCSAHVLLETYCRLSSFHDFLVSLAAVYKTSQKLSYT